MLPDSQRKFSGFRNSTSRNIPPRDSPPKAMGPPDDAHLIVFRVCGTLKMQRRSICCLGGDRLLSNWDSVQGKARGVAIRNGTQDFHGEFYDEKLEARYGLGPSLRKLLIFIV